MGKIIYRIIPGSAGCFLDPPKWPTYSYHVEGRRACVREADEFLSLTYALELPYAGSDIKMSVLALLDKAQRELPPLSDPSIVEWAAGVENYFRHCYSKDGIDRSVSNCVIRKRGLRSHSLAVLHIREWYPNYTITKAIKDAMPTAGWGSGK
jgi:hypothetical protein